MKVVTFGELMVRLQPFNYERFVQANSLEFSFGGGEANVAVSLANYVWTQLSSLSSPHTQSVRPLSTACAVTALIPA